MENGLGSATAEVAFVVGVPGSASGATLQKVGRINIEDDLKLAGLKVSNWHETAEDRDKWREIIDKLGDPKKRKPKNHTKTQKSQGNDKI